MMTKKSVFLEWKIGRTAPCKYINFAGKMLNKTNSKNDLSFETAWLIGFFFDATMSMKPSITMRICKLALFFLFISLSAESVSSAEIVFTELNDNESKVSYSDHCSSVVPESVPNSKAYSHSFGTFGRFETGYYTGGDGILNPKITAVSNSFSFQTRYASKTVADGVWKIKASLTFQGSYDPISNPVHLNLHGFWSEFSGNLCMVGTGSAYSKQGNLLTPSAVFKLRNLWISSNITNLITGTLESLSCGDGLNQFEPISMIMFPRLDSPLDRLPSRSFCSMMLGHVNEFKLQYTSDCSFGKQKCLPFVSLNGYSPRFLSFLSIRCSEVERRVQVLVEFRNTSHGGTYPSFNPNTTLIGEGTWDNKKNQLFVFVCRILGIGESWSIAHVGDCTIRLAFSFPAILSIRETSGAMGQIWTTKARNDSGYFNRTAFRTTGNHMEGIPGSKYEYTEFNRVKNLCLRNVQLVQSKGRRYPNGHSTDMKFFDFLVKSSKKKHGWGSLDPLAVGDQLYNPHLYPMDLPSTMFERAVHTTPINVSYEVSMTLQTPKHLVNGVHASYIEEKVEITAEGVYDPETGKLCMIGCRKLGSDNGVFDNVSMDCEILLNFQFGPLEPSQNGGFIMGSIESTRKSSDPFYFDRLDASSATYKIDERKISIWTVMDLETTKVLLSNTLMCIFVGLQLYHVKNNPQVLPSISIFMLVILTLGNMIPLALDYETLCPNKQHRNKIPLQTEVIVMVVMVVAFLLQLRLLQLTASTRSRDSNRKSLRSAEEMTLLVIAFLYAAGAKFMLLVAWEKRGPNVALLLSSSAATGYQHRSICNYLKSYAGLILDSFLLPQILLNMFSNSKQKALSSSFYIGITFVRSLNVFHNISQYPVNHDDQFFIPAAAWDAWGPILLAAIVHFQQKFGGHCILPSRFRQSES